MKKTSALEGLKGQQALLCGIKCKRKTLDHVVFCASCVQYMHGDRV